MQNDGKRPIKQISSMQYEEVKKNELEAPCSV